RRVDTDTSEWNLGVQLEGQRGDGDVQRSEQGRPVLTDVAPGSEVVRPHDSFHGAHATLRTRAQRSPQHLRPPVRIATWNVNSLKVRLPRVEEWLDYAQPDVLCMQETKLSDAAFPAMSFASRGYDAVHHGSGRWNGVAILS